MTNRRFSVIRRTSNMVDIVAQYVQGTLQYRVKWATTFSGVFTQILAPSNHGFLDSSIPQSVLTPAPGHNVRIVFDPTNPSYAITNPEAPIWLKVAYWDGATETYSSAPSLILPSGAHSGIGTTIIRGDAPLGATIANSLRLDLPFLIENIRIHNEGGNDLYVATDENGPEVKFATGQPPALLTLTAAQASLFVRGAGGATTFTASFTRSFPR